MTAALLAELRLLKDGWCLDRTTCIVYPIFTIQLLKQRCRIWGRRGGVIENKAAGCYADRLKEGHDTSAELRTKIPLRNAVQ